MDRQKYFPFSCNTRIKVTYETDWQEDEADKQMQVIFHKTHHYPLEFAVTNWRQARMA